MKPGPFLSIVLLIVLLLLSLATAHVPLMAGGNENISTALHISDPGKSWAIYGILKPETVQYYSFDRELGDRISLMLLRSADSKDNDFQPNLVLLGPGVKSSGQLSKDVILPASLSDLGAMVVYGKGGANATYEPFGPSSYIEMAEINISAPQSARYYAAVFSNSTAGQASANGAGHYILVVGYREEFSFSERIIAPIRLISVYIWEGQSAGIVFFPYLIAEVIGILVFWKGSRRTLFCLARGEAGILQRSLLAVLGTIALLAGSGLILGPILAIAASLLPSKKGSILSNC